MPVLSWAHSQYWQFDDGVAAPVPVSRAGYPAWQGGVLTGSMFGAIQRWWEFAVFAWRWAKRLKALSVHDQLWLAEHLTDLASLKGDRRLVLTHTMKVLQSPHYPLAREAVRSTATTLGFNKPTEWAKVGARHRGDIKLAENTWRHMEAMDRFHIAVNEPLPNTYKNFMVELAYQGYALKPRD